MRSHDILVCDPQRRARLLGDKEESHTATVPMKFNWKNFKSSQFQGMGMTGLTVLFSVLRKCPHLACHFY